jgi:hypothetical protein
MALSCKGDDHSEVERLFIDEIQELSNDCHMFYHGGLRKVIPVKVGKLSTCIDRPERSSMFQVGDHNGTYSTFWGHATFVDGECQQNRLPSCVQCRENHLKVALLLTEDDASHHNSPCNNEKCSSWNVFSESFQFPLPKLYPTTCDTRPTAPSPPTGREIFGNKRPASSLGVVTTPHPALKTIPLSTCWLKSALIFAHHNMKTMPPDSTSIKKRFWTKGAMTSYLRSCGVNSQLIDAVYVSARNNDDEPPFPASWLGNSDAIEICHYAPMHMLFLGHVKSNYDMTSKFLSKYDMLATFGKQANLYLRLIQKLRVGRYYAAQPLSTSSWGTGVWVSENYLCWARCIKFFATLPGLHNTRIIASDNGFHDNLMMYLRFVTASHHCISRIMSPTRFVPMLDTSIKVYLDTMVEFDRWLFNLKDNEDLDMDEDVSDNADSNTAASAVAVVTTARTKGKSSKPKKPNFVKSNSLGIMSASSFHSHFGPAQINWDGGWSGERKIQPVKPLLSIKRSNAEWQRLTLKKLYQNESINWLLNSMSCNHTPSSEPFSCQSDRGMEGVLKVFQSMDAAMVAVNDCNPITGLICQEGKKVWIPYRPKGRKGTSRSSVDLVEVMFDDVNGIYLHSLCWMASISVTGNIKMFESLKEISTFAHEYILMLPQLVSDRGSVSFVNKYYCVGHSWTERNSKGEFLPSHLDASIFSKW